MSSPIGDVCQFTNTTAQTIDPPQDTNETTTSVVTQQIEFVETAPTDVHILSQPAPVDMAYVESLRSFLTRPYPIFSDNWTGDQGQNSLVVSLDPMKLYLNHSLILSKLQGFSYLRAGLRMELRINGTRFHYGQLVAGFQPLAGTLQSYTTNQTSATSLTMFPCMCLDPGPSQVGVLEVPYVHPDHFFSLTSTAAPPSLGLLVIKVLVPLRVVAEEAVPRVSYTLYVSLVDPILNAFTADDPLVPLFEEQGMDSSTRVNPEANNFFATDINDVSVNAAMSSTNSIENGEQFIGVSRRDMLLSEIYTRPNMLTRFNWTTSQIAGTNLETIAVTPDWSALNTTYLQNLVRLLQFWRGALRYHVRVVASGFHSGRLLISWEPPGGANSTDLYKNSNRMSMVVDIQETTDVYFTVPYMSRHPWLSTRQVSPEHSYANGKLHFTVLNPLAVPDSSVSTVTLLVWAYGSSTLEFAVPKISPDFVPILEEQCASVPLDDSRFGNLDGSFDVPGTMVIGEKLLSVGSLLAKKAAIYANNISQSHFTASVYQTLSPYSHFAILKRMFLLHRGSVAYAAFMRQVASRQILDEFYLTVRTEITSPSSELAVLQLGAYQVRSATPNAMLTVPYYSNRLFYTTYPPVEPADMPAIAVYTPLPSESDDSYRMAVWASLGHDYMLAYLIPPTS